MSSSQFANAPLAPPDPIFHLTASYKADTDSSKINLGVGAYRDDNEKPWVLPVVRKAEQIILNDASLDHEYLPIDGLKTFTEAAARLILGKDSPAISEKRYAACQAISGTGALKLGAEFLARYKKGVPVYISKPTWANHKNIFVESGFEVKEYRYWDQSTRGLDIKGLLDDINAAPNGSIIVLHTCAHNPTGVDPTEEQWTQIADAMTSKGHFAFFDCAYQGFASGNVDRDAYSVRYFTKRGIELFVAQSFSKNFGLYNERAGCLTVVAKDGETAEIVRSQLSRLQRAMISNPPAFGARIVSTILNSDSLNREFLEQVNSMASRIIEMRKALYNHLVELKTPGTWTHITSQIGMFSFTGLNANQSKTLKEKFHVYLTDNGRISMAGLNTKNVERFAKSLDWVVRNVQ